MFDIHQEYRTSEGEWDEELACEYCDGLMEAFAESPEGQRHWDKYGSFGSAEAMMDFAFNYPGVSPADMTLSDFHEVLYDLFPRKVSAEPEEAREIIDELRAFWQFLLRAYQLPQAMGFLAELDDGAEEELREALSNPSNFGMAKSFFMTGKQAGFDMTTQDGLDAFVTAFNAGLFEPDPPTRSAPFFGGIPVPAGSPTPSHTRRRGAKAKKKSRKKSKRRHRR